jgi:FkbH-like protein
MAAGHEVTSLRDEIDLLVAQGAAAKARLRMAELWRREPRSAAASFITTRLDKIRDQLPLAHYKVAILRSFTVEPMVAPLRAAAFSHGIDLAVHVGDFNAYAQEILDRDGPLYRFAPDAVILAVRTADLAPDLWLRFADLAPEAAQQAAQRVVSNLRQWLAAFRDNSTASLIVHSLELPLCPGMGILDSQTEAGQSEAIRRTNQELRQIATTHRGMYVLDYDALMARHGRERWHDQRLWLTARLPISADHITHMAQEWLRFIVPLARRSAKALVVDLDNTLWGGVIGEEGLNGIKLGAEYPGAAYQALQRTMLDLKRRGILLAICSKNNAEDAMEVLEKHPGMLLRAKDFAATRINWSDKVVNLQEIAAELNISIDALAFADDNRFECEQVWAALPEVTVIHLGENPMNYASIVHDNPVFERLTLSAEDHQRGAMYAEQQLRAQAEQNFRTKEDFFRYLAQEADIETVSDATLARVSQLTQKTNQFNLTTRRYTEQEIAILASLPDWKVMSIRVRDRFGDHGLVGVAMIRTQGEVCQVENFLLSCRVIGRTVETALLAHLAHQAAERGCNKLEGWFLPTKKNQPARDFYPKHGFREQEKNGAGSLWSLDLGTSHLSCPEWIKLNSPNGGKH